MIRVYHHCNLIGCNRKFSTIERADNHFMEEHSNLDVMRCDVPNCTKVFPLSMVGTHSYRIHYSGAHSKSGIPSQFTCNNGITKRPLLHYNCNDINTLPTPMEPVININPTNANTKNTVKLEIPLPSIYEGFGEVLAAIKKSS